MIVISHDSIVLQTLDESGHIDALHCTIEWLVSATDLRAKALWSGVVQIMPKLDCYDRRRFVVVRLDGWTHGARETKENRRNR